MNDTFAGSLIVGAFDLRGGIRPGRLDGALEKRLQAALGALVAFGAFVRLFCPFFGGFDIWHGEYDSSPRWDCPATGAEQLDWFQQNPAIAGVAAGCNPAFLHRRRNGAVGFLQVSTIGEAATRCRFPHLTKSVR